MSKQWFNEKEQVKTKVPLLISLWLVKVFPLPVVCVIVFPISFFYFLFSRRARVEIRRFQNQMKTFTGGHIPHNPSIYKTFAPSRIISSYYFISRMPRHSCCEMRVMQSMTYFFCASSNWNRSRRNLRIPSRLRWRMGRNIIGFSERQGMVAFE